MDTNIGGPAPALLVVLERGSVWPYWPANGTIVVMQQPGEDSLLFARRVKQRIARLPHERRQLQDAIFAVADGTSPDQFESRALMVRAALRSMWLTREGSIQIAVSETASKDMRDDLFALVDTLQDDLPQRDSVRITLDNQPPTHREGRGSLPPSAGPP